MTPAVILAGGRSQRSGRIHKSCRRLPAQTRTWLDGQVLRLRRAGFAPIILVGGQRSRRLWRCCHYRVHRRVNRRASQGGPFSSILQGLGTGRSAALLVQSDTPIPPVWQLRRLRTALCSSKYWFAQFCDQKGQGGHPVLLGKNLVNKIVHHSSGEPTRLDYILRGLPVETRARVVVRRWISFPSTLNTQREWQKGSRLLRRWGRKK